MVKVNTKGKEPSTTKGESRLEFEESKRKGCADGNGFELSEALRLLDAFRI